MKMLQQSYKQSIKFLETNKKQKNTGKIKNYKSEQMEIV